ncbi:MAG: 2'-5' RNA ligase family protein [Bacteroidetes bacterium]|nr:2'-5' RNA ligase family protein [Bacteroidota bacterium]
MLSPPPAIKKEVWDIKKQFHRKHNHIRVAQSAPHIMLANFWLNKQSEEAVISGMEEVAKHQSPVEVRLKNFSHFQTHTIYIDVENPYAIISLVKSLKEKLGLHGSQSFFPMKPHMTIASGLREEQFKKAIVDFQQHEFRASFIADNMLLMKKETGDAGYRIIKEFDFCSSKDMEPAAKYEWNYT